MRNLILSGGSYNAIMYIGCLRRLEKAGMMNSISTIIGTSAGSVVAFLIALHFTSDEITSFMMEHLADIPSIDAGGGDDDDSGIDACALLEICNTYGLDDGSRLTSLFRLALASKAGGASDITFMELGKRFGKHLVICGTNLTKRRSEHFSIDSTPDMSVITALRISCSYPILFTPVLHAGDLYVDGGMYNNFPMNYLETAMSTNPLCEKETIGINICVPRQKITSFTSYVLELLSSVVEKANRSEELSALPYVCNIEQALSTTIDLAKIRLDPQQINALVDKGYVCMDGFLQALTSSQLDEAC